jgi:hypothetical protein
VTYKAFDVHLQRPAALKIINAQIFDNARPLYKGSSRRGQCAAPKAGPKAAVARDPKNLVSLQG